MEKNIVFGDMVWGSCQYDTAADTYHAYEGSTRKSASKPSLLKS